MLDNRERKTVSRVQNDALPKRLRAIPTFDPSYVYHVTRGIHLSSIKRYGLIAQDKSEYNYSSKRNWFSPDLTLAYKLYGTEILQSRYPRMSLLGGSKFVEKYFQGVAILRCKPSHLFSLDYTFDLKLSLVGERKVGPQAIEVFIDGQWETLNRVKLKWTPWPTFYKVTKFLRSRP